MQVGGGEDPVPESKPVPLSVEWYRYKDNLKNDLEAAALVISHAGKEGDGRVGMLKGSHRETSSASAGSSPTV